jgi:uncharacterized membrane protein YeaQ/YmgE (transglycosylase-associated protein family)
VVGLIAGWLAGNVMTGAGYGLIGDIVTGLVGALIGRVDFQSGTNGGAHARRGFPYPPTMPSVIWFILLTVTVALAPEELISVKPRVGMTGAPPIELNRPVTNPSS